MKILRPIRFALVLSVTLTLGVSSAWAKPRAPSSFLCQAILSRQVAYDQGSWAPRIHSALSYAMDMKRLQAPDGTPIKNQADLYSYRIANDPELLQYFSGTPFWENGNLRVWNETQTAQLYEMAGKKIAERIPPGKTGDYLMPGMVVAEHSEGLKEPFLSLWKVGHAIDPKRIRSTFQSEFGILELYDWAEMIVHLGILPLSPGTATFHDFGHLLSTLRNPREELMLQKKFYSIYLENLGTLKNPHASKTYQIQIANTAMLLFEYMTLPKEKVLAAFFTDTKKEKYRDAFRSFITERTGMIDAEKVIQAKVQGPVQAAVSDFENTFLRADQNFYEFFDAYGGAYHDTYNATYRHSGLVTNHDSSSLELLYVNYKNPTQNEEGRRENVIRLLAAFYNAHVGKISFDQVFTDATSSLSPLQGTRSSDYFLSYGNENFRQKFLDDFPE